MSEKLVAVATYNNATEAELARGRLEAAGIACLIRADDAGGMYPQLQFGRGVRVMVNPADAEAARDILTPPDGSTADRPDDEVDGG